MRVTSIPTLPAARIPQAISSRMSSRSGSSSGARSKQLLDFGCQHVAKIGPRQRIGDIRSEEAELRSAVESAPLIFVSIEGLALEQGQHRVGDLNLAAGSFLLRSENIENFRLKNIAAENGEIGRLGSGLRLLHHTVDRQEPSVVFAAQTDHAVILDLLVGHGLHGENIAAAFGVSFQHLAEAAFAFCLDQNVGKEESERLMTHQLARAPDRVAEPERLLLPGEARA